jgi:hypothetical protein
MKAYLHTCTARPESDPLFSAQPRYNFQTTEIEVKTSHLWWQNQGLQYTASGYGKRIPTEYMVKVNNRWRRVYCRIYSNNGTLYIGELDLHGNMSVVQIDK